MKLANSTLVLVLAAAPCACAQEAGNLVYQAQGPGPGTAGPVAGVAMGGIMKGTTPPIKGAPFSATITNESVQTLADGNRIVQSSTGGTARDSQGRTRQDFALPAIGNLSAAEAPRLVFIQDPVAQTSYTLNLADKTAQKIPMPPLPPGRGAWLDGATTFSVQTEASTAIGVAGPTPVTEGPIAGSMTFHKLLPPDEQAQVTTEDLGTQTIEGVVANGVRTTRTISAGQIGNDKPIVIVTEVWTSPDLKTIISSKRIDPRMGEQTFKLTNLVRAEPDASLFAVPPDFKLIEAPQHIMYRSNR
jgi:hypothetical protein